MPISLAELTLEVRILMCTIFLECLLTLLLSKHRITDQERKNKSPALASAARVLKLEQKPEVQHVFFQLLGFSGMKLS